MTFRHACDRHSVSPDPQSEFARAGASTRERSLDEWLMERYSAFNNAGGRKRFSRVWHPPWPQCRAEVKLRQLSLLTADWRWFEPAQLVGADYSPSLLNVRAGRPQHVRR